MIFASTIGLAGDHGEDSNRLRLLADSRGDVKRYLAKHGQPGSFVEVRHVDKNPLPTLRPEEKQHGFLVFKRHWMDLVFPHSVPTRKEIGGDLTTFASLGESEPTTFCLKSLRDLHGISVDVGELVAANGDRLRAPKIEIVRCVPRLLHGEEPLYENGPVGVMNMPTYLEPARALDVAGGRTVQYWLTITVDHDDAPGVYSGSVSITLDKGPARKGQPERQLRLRVEVLPVRLKEPTRTLGFWDFQREYHGAIGSVDEVYKIMRRHGVNSVFARCGLFEYDSAIDSYGFGSYLSTEASGHVSVTLSGSSLEQRMESATKAGFTSVVYNPHLPIFASLESTRRFDDEKLREQSADEVKRVVDRYRKSPNLPLISRETEQTSRRLAPIYSEAYATLYATVLGEILAQARRRNWSRLLLDPGDETYTHHVRDRIAFPRVIRDLEIMKRVGATTIMNHLSPSMPDEYGDYAREALRFLDVAMPGVRLGSTSPYGGTIEQTAADCNALGVTTFTYSMSGQSGVRPDLSATRFNSGFFFYTRGKNVQGTFDYIFYRPEGDPYNPIDTRLWSHERLWYFPPQPESKRLGGRALALVAKREGIDDLRYLDTLNELIAHAQSSSVEPPIQEAIAAATSTREAILSSLCFTDEGLDTNQRALASRWDESTAAPGVAGVVKGSFRLRNGWQFAAYDHHRRQITDAIIRLQDALRSVKLSR